MQNQWFWQILQVSRRSLDVTNGAHSLQRTAVRYGCQQGHRSATVGDLNRLALFDQAKQAAGPLTKLTDSYRCHVLLVAQAWLGRQLAEVCLRKLDEFFSAAGPDRPGRVQGEALDLAEGELRRQGELLPGRADVGQGRPVVAERPSQRVLEMVAPLASGC